MATIACGEAGLFPIVVSSGLAGTGQTIYTAECLSCHGDEQGRGVLPGAPVHTDRGHTWHHADRQLFDFVMDGSPTALVMPAFRGKLTEDEVVAVLAYIKTMWSEDIRVGHADFSGRYEESLKEFPLQ